MSMNTRISALDPREDSPVRNKENAEHPYHSRFRLVQIDACQEWKIKCQGQI
jgi:hypothetical protein